MRILTDYYDKVFVDIDNSLVYGPMTTVMHYTWEWFHSNLIGSILMTLQQKLKLYKVNRKLVYTLKDLDKVAFITVRAKHRATKELIKDIFGREVELIELASDQGHVDKIESIYDFLQEEGNEYADVCLIDDNVLIQQYARMNDIDVFDPVVMREGLYLND